MIFEVEELTEVVTEVALKCPRCKGSGHLEQYRRIASGVCFKCDGKGTSTKTKTVKTEKTTTYTAKATIMEDGDTFEAMFERYQEKQKDFNLFDWFNEA